MTMKRKRLVSKMKSDVLQRLHTVEPLKTAGEWGMDEKFFKD